jgi:hypothetical protein
MDAHRVVGDGVAPAARFVKAGIGKNTLQRSLAVGHAGDITVCRSGRG